MSGKHAGILQITVDLATGTPLSEPISLWSGTGLKFPEAPHLYQHDGAWYLVIAEGGTERGHGISVARGPRASGPFESGPGNPVVSARSTSRPIQNTGHGDLVQTPDGGWAVVMLGMRPKGATQAFSALGRETFITPARWTADGWLEIDPVILNPRPDDVDESDAFERRTLCPPTGSPCVATRPRCRMLQARPGWCSPATDRRWTTCGRSSSAAGSGTRLSSSP